VLCGGIVGRATRKRATIKGSRMMAKITGLFNREPLIQRRSQHLREGITLLLQEPSSLYHSRHPPSLGSEDTETWRERVRNFREDSFVYPPVNDELEDGGPAGDVVEDGDNDKRETSSRLRLRSRQMLKSSSRMGSEF
jgi:hypothetical protein